MYTVFTPWGTRAHKIINLSCIETTTVVTGNWSFSAETVFWDCHPRISYCVIPTRQYFRYKLYTYGLVEYIVFPLRVYENTHNYELRTDT